MKRGISAVVAVRTAIAFITIALDIIDVIEAS